MKLERATRSEDTEQIAVISWAEWQQGRYPELKWLHHIPNGGSRNRLEAVKLKQMGVKAGVSDLCLPYPRGIYCGLYIEMKYGNNRQQETQKAFLGEMAFAGHYVATCYSAEEAVKVIEDYLKLPPSGKDEIIIRDIAKYTENDNVRKEVLETLMPYPNNSIFKNGKVKEAQEND